MVGDTETPGDYDGEWDWDKLVDSGILEELIQKAEHENAVKRTTQLTQAESLPDCEILEDLIQKAEHESAVKRATQVVPTFATPQTLINPSVLPSRILSTAIPATNAAQVSGGAYENDFNLRSQVNNGPRKPPLPFELRGSQGYFQDRIEGTYQPINLSQLPTQTPGSFKYGTPVNEAASTPYQPSNGVHRVHANDQLAEKNGTISALRSKLQQADSELYDLRKRLAAQASSQHIPQFQQKELERLSFELSVKDQEVLEARRAVDEKDDRLRDALASAAALKEELQNLKRLKSAQDPVSKDGPSYSQDDDDDEMIAACDERQLELIHDQAKKLELEKTQHGASEDAVTSKEALDATVLKSRTVDDGCVTSNQKETGVSPPQASELPLREQAGTSGGVGANAPAPQLLISGGVFVSKDDAIPRELSLSLQQIWNPRGRHNESVSLVSELFAVCRDDLYILLTYEGTLKDAVKGSMASEARALKSVVGAKRKQVLNIEQKKMQESVGSKLHDALAKAGHLGPDWLGSHVQAWSQVANSLMPSATILGPLLEYSNCDNADLVQSALHVLRCVLRQDSFCREKVLARKIPVAGNVSSSRPLGISDSFSRLDIAFEGRGWHMPSIDMRQQQIGALPVFSSPRVVCGRSQMQDVEVTEDGIIIYHGKINEEEQEETRAMHIGNDAEVDMASRSDLNPFVEGLLDMATHSSNFGIRFNAIVIIVLLVAHTEPISERAQFGSLLWCERLASVLKETAGEIAGVGIQLQAIRLVQLLLHCPVLFRMFCSALDTSLGGCWCEVRKQGEARSEEARTHAQSLELQGRGDLCRVVLDSISSCLDCSGSSLQAIALRRDALHALTFLASSGDAAVRILLHAQMKLEPSSVPFKDSNISTDGGNGLQSENPQQEPGSRRHSASGDAAAALRGEGYCFDIPCKLISLLAWELKAEEDGANDAKGCAEVRACLIRETLVFFNKLLCNQMYSREVMNWIIASKEITRLVLGVLDQLIRRGGSSEVDLAKGLQNKIVPELTA